MKSLYTKFKSLGLSFLAAIALIVGASAWADSVTLSAKDSQGNSIGAISVGNPISFTASTPVASANTIAQEIVSTWDATRLNLTSYGEITYPSGWTLGFSIDGGNSWTATVPSNLSQVNAIKSSGNLVSAGVTQSGNQLAKSIVNKAAPLVATTIPIPGAGDGWDVFFDPNGTKIFNVYHHSNPPKIDCHMRDTGGSCSGWPTGGVSYDSNVASNYRSTGVVLSDGRILIPSTKYLSSSNEYAGGFSCVTTSGSLCSTSFINLTNDGSLSRGRDGVGDVVLIAGKAYTIDVVGGQLLCFDTEMNSQCDPDNKWVPPGSSIGSSAVTWSGPVAKIISYGPQIFGYIGGKVFCYDTQTHGVCSGWSQSSTSVISNGEGVYSPLLDASGNLLAVCVASYTSCAKATDGSVYNPSLPAKPNMNENSYSIAYGNVASKGSRVYWETGSPLGAGWIGCWDFSTNAYCWGVVTWALPSQQAYAVRLDPFLKDCLWVNGHTGGINSYSVAGPGLPTSGCSGSVPVVTFSGDVSVPRMGCSANSSIKGWQTFKVTGLLGVSSAKLTVLNSNSGAIAGWVDIAGLIDSNGAVTWNLSTLNVNQTGQKPSFQVTLSNIVTGATISGEILAEGDAPQLCWNMKAQPGCPVGFGVANLPLPAPAATSVSSSGNYQVQGGGAGAFNASAMALTQTAPDANVCLGSISGYVRKNSTTTGFAGIPVNLVSAAGTPITLNGSAVTTTTNADGSYVFSNLYPNSAVTSPTTSQQYAVTFGVPTGYSFVGTDKTAISATSPITFTSGQTSPNNVTPFVATPPVGTTAPPAGQLASTQTAVVSAFYNPPPQLLSIKKIPSAISFFPLGAATAAGSYTVTVTNSGTTATGTTNEISFVDTLPSGMTIPSGPLTLLSGSTSGWACTATGQTVTCTNKPSTNAVSLVANGTATIKYSVYIAAATSASDYANTYLNNAGFVAGKMGGDTRTPNCSTMVAPTIPSLTPAQSGDGLCTQALVGVQAQVTLSKAISTVNGAAATSATTLKAGDVVKYAITALNNSSTTAVANLNLSETVPAGTTYTGASEGWNCAVNSAAGTACTQTVASIAASATSTKYFTVTLGAVASSTIANTLTSTSSFAQCSGSNASGCTASNPTVPKVALAKVQSDASGSTVTSYVNSGGFTYFKVSVSNIGGSSTTSTLTFTDTLPVGLVYNATASATGGFACTYASGTRIITCTSSSPLAAGASANVVYKVDVAANATGSLANTAIMTAMGGDTTTPSSTGLSAGQAGTSTNGTAARAVITVQPPASLTVTKALTNISRSGSNITTGLSSAQVQAGDVLTYTISATAVTSNYTGVVLTETLPANTNYSGTNEGWTAGSSYTQSVDVTAGATVTKTFTVTVSALGAGVTAVNNTLTATNPSGSTNLTSPVCSSCATSNPTPPQIKVVKAAPAAIYAGAQAIYNIVVSNVGGTVSSGTLQINDTLPSGVTFDYFVGGTGGFTTSTTAGASNIAFTTSSALAAGASATITYKVAVAANAPAPIINHAALDSTNKGGDPRTPSSSGLITPASGSTSNSTDATNSSTATPLTTGNPGVTKTLTSIKRGAVTTTGATLMSMATTAGDILTYTITATELSGSAASAGATVIETVPVNTVYSGTGENWTVSGSNYEWATGNISAGQSLTKTFTVTVQPSVTNNVSNTASTSSPGVCLSCTVVTPTAPHLAFSNQYSATSVGPSGNVNLIAMINNTGGSGTSGTIAFTETLPTGLTLAGSTVTVNGFTCTAINATPQVVTCTSTSPISASGSASVILPLSAANNITGSNLNANLAATSIANDPRASAIPSASGLTNATTGANSAASSTVDTTGLYSNAALNTVQGTLTTTKTLYQFIRGGVTTTVTGTPVIQPGDELIYKVVVAETAGQYSATTTLTETVPANTTYTGASEGWTSGCAAVASTCTQAVTVVANGSASVYFTVTAASSFASGVTSVANTVASSANPSCSTCTVSNLTPPLLAIEKIANQASIPSLNTGTFTVTISNHGGAATSGDIKFNDTLPSGLSFVSATGAHYTCSAVGQIVTCTYSGTIAAGASAAVTYTVRASGAASTGKINNVVVDPAYMGGDIRTNNDTSSSASTPGTTGSSGGTVSTSGLSAKAMVDIGTATTSAISGKAKKVGGGAVRGEAGITVQLKDSSGQPVLDNNNQPITAVTDANGDYQFFGLTPGQTYGIAFVPPAGTATAAPENSGGVNGTASGSAITSIAVPTTPGVVPNQNAVIVDPSGVIYNSQTRTAISGAAVWILDPNGNKVADSSLDTAYGTANGALTSANGSYKLFLKDTSASGTYSVVVVPPGCSLSANAPYSVTCPSTAAYQTSNANGTSSLIPAQSGAYTPALGGGIENIQSQSTLPTGTQATTYYTSFAFTFSPGSAAGTSNGVANNHIPIDPVASLTISKTALTGLVPTVPTSYTVNVSNSATGGTAPGATVLEKIPAGLSLNNIGGTGWTCTKQDGTALNYPVAGEVIAKCTSATLISPGANANAITVSVTPDASVINQTVYTYSSVDPTGHNSPPTPGTSCSPTNACASNSGSVSSGSATLFLQKMVSATTAELGDSVMYTLKLEHKAGSPQSGVKIVDTLPLGFKYIAGTVKMLRSGSVSTTTTGDAAMGVTGAGPVLNFTIGTMSQGDVATITYRVRLAVGSQQGTGINRAIATTSAGFSSNEARATVKVTNGVFAQEGCIIGKVYLDCNHNGIQDQEDGDEPGVGGVRLYMEDGTYMVSDRQGKYSICGVSAMTHVLKVDKTTLPPGAELGITANRNALDPDSLFVDLKFGELHRADFLINNCSTDVLNDVDARQDRSGAPMGTYPQPNNKQPTKSQSFSLKEQRAKQRFYQEGK